MKQEGQEEAALGDDEKGRDDVAIHCLNSSAVLLKCEGTHPGFHRVCSIRVHFVLYTCIYQSRMLSEQDLKAELCVVESQLANVKLTALSQVILRVFTEPESKLHLDAK